MTALPEETKEAIRKEIAGVIAALGLIAIVFFIGFAIGWVFGRFL